MPTAFEPMPLMDGDLDVDEDKDEDDASFSDLPPAIMRLGSFLQVDTTVGRMIWAATSLGTSRYLLTGHINYPLHLLAVHLAAIQIARLCSARSLRAFTHIPAKQVVPDVPTAILTALTVPVLVSGYKSLALSGNMFSLVMIVSLNWRPSSLLQKVVSLDLRASDIIRYGIFVAGLLAILLCDYRLRPVPRDMSLACLGFIGLAQLVAGFKTSLREDRSWNQGHHLGIWQTFWPLCPLVAVTVLMVKSEPLRVETHISLYPTTVTLAVNILATVVATLPTSLELDLGWMVRSDSSTATIDVSLLDLAVRTGLAGVVSAASLFLSPRPAMLSSWQCGGYLMAIFAFVTGNDLKSIFQPPNIRDEVFDRPNTNWLLSKGTGLLALVGASWLYSFYSAISVGLPLIDSSNLALKPPPMPHADLDVVVARYAESPISLANDINSLFATPNILSLETRVIIYNKNTAEDDFKTKLLANLPEPSKVEFRPLENIGREADTYLHHIVSNWDHLSKHTLFMQAEPHDLPRAKQYLQQFFVPETGFLSLSYEGNVCESCEYCHDAGWSEDSALVSRLYASANTGKPCKDLVLTYRGQFVVSGARIRGNDKTLYEALLRQLRDPESDMHSGPYTNSVWHRHQTDSLQSPAFGFTLERMWGVLMQCSNLRVGYGAPSQLAVSARPSWVLGDFPLDTAQCLDRPVEAVQQDGDLAD